MRILNLENQNNLSKVNKLIKLTLINIPSILREIKKNRKDLNTFAMKKKENT